MMLELCNKKHDTGIVESVDIQKVQAKQSFV